MSSSTQSVPEQAEDAELEGSPAGVHATTTITSTHTEAAPRT